MANKQKSTSCVGCKFLYSRGLGFSNFTWDETLIQCAKDKNTNLIAGEDGNSWPIQPCDWNRKEHSDNWPVTNNSRCDIFSKGVFVQLDVEGDNGPADSSGDEEQIIAICEHSGRQRNGRG